MSACPPNASEGSFSFSLGSFFHHSLRFKDYLTGHKKTLQDINTSCSLPKQLSKHEKQGAQSRSSVGG
jgi:hypothetical protein